MELIKAPYNDQRVCNSAIDDYRALKLALLARGESFAGSIDGVDRWTRTYAAKRTEKGELIILPIKSSSWYYVICSEKVNKIFVWVGGSLDKSCKLNKGGYRELTSEGRKLTKEAA